MIKIVFLAAVLALLGNLMVLNLYVFRHDSKIEDVNTRILMLSDGIKRVSLENNDKVETLPEKKPVDLTSSECGEKCVAAIDTAVDAKIAGLKALPAPTKQVVNQDASKTREWIIPMGGGEVTQNGQWVDIYSAQTQLNTANYPQIITAYFEVVMRIPNAQGVLSARLYDTTTPYLFAGQVLSTDSGLGQFLSTQFPIQSGNKSYHVQLNNSIGSGVLDSARIRLVTK